MYTEKRFKVSKNLNHRSENNFVRLSK